MIICSSRFTPFFAFFVSIYLLKFGLISSTTIVTRLVHYLNVDAPTLVNPNMSMLQISYLDLERSIARASYLAEAATNRINHPTTTNLETSVVGKTTGFLALVRLGANSLHQSIYMDTGSNLLWFYCDPCTHMAPYPLFDPKLSYTFENESCLGTRVCSLASTVSIECDGMGGCTYEVRYGRGRTKGYLARDRLRFENEGDIDGAVFGCARSASNISTDGNGVLGLLINNSISLIAFH